MQAKLLTQEQLAALISFAQDNGRNWKTELRHSWMTCNYAGRTDGHLLQQIRNQVRAQLAGQVQPESRAGRSQ